VESISRILSPVPIHFAEAIAIACLGLAVNVASAWLLSGGDHHHGHGLAQVGHDHDEPHRITTQEGVVILEIFEDGMPPRFRLHSENRTLDRCTLRCHRDQAARGGHASNSA
jgi:Co/Zn/Cd efflux system component